MEFPFDDDLRHRITRNLAAFVPRRIDNPDLRGASVAIIVAKSRNNRGACVFLTLRPRHMNRHSGQLALPGGRRDERESVVEAALRETHEELGLCLPENQVIGTLDDYATRSGFCISPIIAWGGKAQRLVPDPNEVDRVFRIPFEELNSPDIPHLSDAGDGRNPVLSAMMPTIGGYVYAPTAAILYQFREVAIRGLNTRVDHFEQPEFAWR